MPPHPVPHLHSSAASPEGPRDHDDGAPSSHVFLSREDEDELAEIHRTLTAPRRQDAREYAEPHSSFDKFLDEEVRAGKMKSNLGVCFQSLSTWGDGEEHVKVKTLGTALWRTLTLQDVYEWTIKPWVSKKKPEDGRQLIRDFSGVVRSSEMMLVLGRPGAGCSTFLKTIAGDHASYLGVTGSIDYSGLSLKEVKTHYRGQVAYSPEDDVHFPTLNVRQTLEFALQCKTPKRYRDRIPRYLEIYGRVFAMSHTMDTLVGNEFIRGVSGGERKRISIIESLATDSAVMCWDNSTRGLDALSALDYARSLRIMTDTCGKATLMTLYQASDAIYDLVDKVLLIDEGRMLYQGPARDAKRYFEDLGYECADMQTVSDFLTSVPIPERRRFKPGWESRAPKGAEELERAFRASSAYEAVERDMQAYEDQRLGGRSSQVSSDDTDTGSLEEFKKAVQTEKSRFVSPKSPYTVSLFRQIVLCARRQVWQTKNHMGPIYIKLMSAVVYGLLIGSLFYDMPQTSEGLYSRGGVVFYSSLMLAWLQMSELEEAMQGRDILSRQKKFAFVRPSAVCLARMLSDIVLLSTISALFQVVVYFLSGLKSNAGSFFIDYLFILLCALALTAQFRLFAAFSRTFEVALRYTGISVLTCIVLGGYVISRERLINLVPWVGWIAYTTPVIYTFEAMMAAEFHNTDFACSPGSIVPSGPSYTDPAYQTCGYYGSRIGTTIIRGDDYMESHFGFYYKNVWRNFGILCLFTVVYMAATCWVSEIKEWESSSAGPIQYKSSQKKLRRNQMVRDEEGGAVQVDVKGVPAARGLPNPDQAHEQAAVLACKSTFTWENLELHVQIGKESRRLLNKVSGYCKPGSLTALVGSSGAGKSTLLTALTQRQSSGDLTGTMFVDGRPTDGSYNRRIGYCQQMDIHDESSTIREAFEFSALLRQNQNVPDAEKLAYVNVVLATLDLVDLQDAVIGCLDIEKKKRVTIGVELCGKPELVLFLDEPTSGLDSQGASSIVALLRKLADQGLAVLCTIHQANQEQFEEFDRVLALSPGGNTYYFGEVGASGRAIFDYFGKHGHKPENVTNAADYLIEIAVSGMKDAEKSVNWVDVWNQSSEFAAVRAEIQAIRGQDNATDPASVHKPSSPSFYRQVKLLSARTLRQYWRSPEYPYSRLYASFAHALLDGLTFYQLGNSATDLESKAFLCFLCLMLVPEFINAISMRFVLNRDIWLAREGPSGMYGWVAFCTTQILCEMPLAIGSGVMFYLICYFTAGLPYGFAAGYSFLMFFLFFLFATSWGQWIAALSADATIAATLMPFFITMCELFNGIIQPHDKMPAFWKYTMYYLTPFTYWIGGVLTSVLRGAPVICEQDELSFFRSPANMTCGEYAGPWLAEKGVGYLSNPNDYDICGYCDYSSGDEYLSQIGLDSSYIWPYFGIFLAYVVFNYSVVYLLVYLRSVKKLF
ncbi:putative ABC multidrug transporter [Aspergillus homomorphus CBS 101889]|uniref:Pleiotropic drug resistance protein, ABC superfamily n=1 Tax=Aspergillus homomorphus (strain CBS 101889) TaxID=1450537 RepID=A0A395HMF5_ASPHC|nr:pleiotropic drug resistance protein, ABC superfamily [Aspergillus homomorphus CBS 101889]RAL09122.1 pleiotropic drug resistance protein, ABC superfamily [Aspergillus homomorphus CBS 101889]